MKRLHSLTVVALLVTVTAIVFAPVAGHGFIDFDDPAYIFNNSHVRGGLTRDGCAWAFTTLAEAHWTPLTWLSHMVDVTCFGVEGVVLGIPSPGWHHMVNVAFHAANSALLFVLLRNATGAVWRSAVVALLFALHPLHVESVAWASERKDVLSTFLGFSCLIAYVHYARRPSAWRYALVFVLFVLGLMAKPMLVTWPFVMLLLDWWPLARWSHAPGSKETSVAPGRMPTGRRKRATPATVKVSSRTTVDLLIEKLPMILAAVACCIVTYYARRATPLNASTSFGSRAQIAVVEYFVYALKTIWPTDLAVLYPYPGTIEIGLTLAAACFLIVVTVTVLRTVRRRPYLAFGWIWFLGTLVPVIGLIQVALHARADRYTYVPLIGIFVALVWTLAEFATSQRAQFLMATIAALSVLACAVVTRNQINYWSDTVSLFRHTCKVTADNGWAHRILGTALAGKGLSSDAIVEYRAALRVWPDDPIAHNNLGSALEAEHQSTEAINEYQSALRLDTGNSRYRRNLAGALARAGRVEEASALFPELASPHAGHGAGPASTH